MTAQQYPFFIGDPASMARHYSTAWLGQFKPKDFWPEDPPALGSPEEAAEIEALLQKQKERTAAKEAAILRQATAGGLLGEYARVLCGSLDEKKLPIHTAGLLNAMIEIGRYIVIVPKLKFNRPRPYQLSRELRPCIADPGHPAYPSGHSLQAHLMAFVLHEVIGSEAFKPRLLDAATDIAEGREWAGVHYASDTAAGRDLAQCLMDNIVAVYGPLITCARAELIPILQVPDSPHTESPDFAGADPYTPPLTLSPAPATAA